MSGVAGDAAGPGADFGTPVALACECLRSHMETYTARVGSVVLEGRVFFLSDNGVARATPEGFVRAVSFTLVDESGKPVGGSVFCRGRIAQEDADNLAERAVVRVHGAFRTARQATTFVEMERIQVLHAPAHSHAQRAPRPGGNIRRIGIVTTPGSAALTDVMASCARAGLPVRATLYDALVQGPRAPASLVAAIGRAQREEDCIVITRGGGARSDLGAFDSPEVCEAVSGCAVPTFVAVGHTRDTLAVERVCTAPSATPTAVAETLAPWVRSSPGSIARKTTAVQKALVAQAAMAVHVSGALS